MFQVLCLGLVNDFDNSYFHLFITATEHASNLAAFAAIYKVSQRVVAKSSSTDPPSHQVRCSCYLPRSSGLLAICEACREMKRCSDEN